MKNKLFLSTILCTLMLGSFSFNSTIFAMKKQIHHKLLDACYKNNIEMVKLLLKNGVTKETINKANNSEYTPLYIACYNNNIEMVTLLLVNGVAKETINKADNSGRTPLYWACCQNNIEMVKLLLANGVTKETINKANKDGKTPLYYACYKNNIEMVRLLLANGITKETINKAGDDGDTPLHWACFNNNIEMVKLLLAKGVTKETINKADDCGETPLYYACDNIEMVRLLLGNGVTKETINKANNNGRTLLYYACYKNNIEMVQLLLEHGADINKANTYGNTLLFDACLVNNIEMVSLLLENGADINKALLDYIARRKAQDDQIGILVKSVYKNQKKLEELWSKLNGKNNTVKDTQNTIQAIGNLILDKQTLTYTRINAITYIIRAWNRDENLISKSDIKGYIKKIPFNDISLSYPPLVEFAYINNAKDMNDKDIKEALCLYLNPEAIPSLFLKPIEDNKPFMRKLLKRAKISNNKEFEDNLSNTGYITDMLNKTKKLPLPPEIIGKIISFTAGKFS